MIIQKKINRQYQRRPFYDIDNIKDDLFTATYKKFNKSSELPSIWIKLCIDHSNPKLKFESPKSKSV